MMVVKIKLHKDLSIKVFLKSKNNKKSSKKLLYRRQSALLSLEPDVADLRYFKP